MSEFPSHEEIQRVTAQAKEDNCIYTGQCYDYDKAWFTKTSCWYQLRCMDRMILRGQIPTGVQRKRRRLKGKPIHKRQHENYCPTTTMKINGVLKHLGVRIVCVPGHIICEKIHHKGGE